MENYPKSVICVISRAIPGSSSSGSDVKSTAESTGNKNDWFERRGEGRKKEEHVRVIVKKTINDGVSWRKRLGSF
jgi:hypothetical protein